MAADVKLLPLPELPRQVRGAAEDCSPRSMAAACHRHDLGTGDHRYQGALMTLLSEYQALPAEPKLTAPQREKRLPYTCTTALCVGCGAPVHGDFGLVPDICTACDAQERARFAGRQVERRDAIIRLLCRALDCAASDLERMEVATHDLRALLTAVERDLKEGV